MNNTIKISKLELNEIPELMNLLKMLDDSPDFDKNAGIPFQNNDDAKIAYKKILNTENYNIYVAKIDDKIVGTFSLITITDIAHKNTSIGVLENLVIDSTYRSCGIGRFLIEESKKLCTKNNCYKMILSTHNSRTETHKFYKKNDFQSTGVSFSIQT